jgi:hypothetical protein
MTTAFYTKVFVTKKETNLPLQLHTQEAKHFKKMHKIWANMAQLAKQSRVKMDQFFWICNWRAQPFPKHRPTNPICRDKPKLTAIVNHDHT